MDRLRWDNIARAAALLGVIALVVAWPHLRRHGPRLPSAAATPVSVEREPAVAPAPRPKPVRRKSRAKRARPARRVVHRVVRHRAPRRAAPAPRPVAPRPAALPAPPPSPDDQAAREFALP